MNEVLTPSTASLIVYTQPTQKRAERALRCAPFRLSLWLRMRSESIPLPRLAGQEGLDQNFTQKPLTERRVESELRWLIQVGLLRREVDGQGITDSFRLTPLGKLLIQPWETLGEIPKASWWERCQNQVRRWLSFSF